jgi:TATA-box binding protein (TBP) (component of TFIID and TFIIIB)
MEQDIKISTITMSIQVPECILNLTNIGKYLQIDSDIVGIKYNCASFSILKGRYCTTVYKKAKLKDLTKINQHLFYNQISIVVNNLGNYVNVKLFGNGSLHLTGCKSIQEGTQVTKLVYEKLLTLREKTDMVLLIENVDGVLIDKDNLVYSQSDKRIIGYMKSKNIYIIHKKEYEIDKKTKLFISRKVEAYRTKELLSMDGKAAGVFKLELIKNRKKLFKRNNNIRYDYENGVIYCNDDTILGKMIYTLFDTTSSNRTKNPIVFEHSYMCDPFDKLDVNIESLLSKIDININCINVYFKMKYHINRQKLYDKFIDYNLLCKYTPESYSGIKLIFKIPIVYDEIENLSGHCTCTNKCTCSNITFLVFQSGNVIATGFRTQEQIQKVTKCFIEMLNHFIMEIRNR